MQDSAKSYQQLQQALGLSEELPVTPDWSAAADFLHLIKDYCLNSRPQTIVECSSGLTSLTLARCCQLNNMGKVFSLENGEEYVQQTRDNLNLFNLDGFTEVIHAPLQNTRLNNIDYAWYTTDSLAHFLTNPVAELKIDMLVIDGPPGFIQKHSRYPALPVLFDQLADNSIIFLDDAARDDEQEIIAMWCDTHPGITHEYIETERGCSILTIRK